VKYTKGLKEGFLRNSAKSPLKFATRGASLIIINRNLGVTENRRVRLSNNNTSLRKIERCRMWADACQVLDSGRRK